ncbi:hypothetical protein PISMIDRAFT_420162 [Pisolithus microcarpus 441]|uniref:Uncharacterized protein n=1 Tax=Pisolithus microcarpus 441 TaxID=765257 RepID=A0A0C9Y7I1_9AGAM|nr:hypothetical protein PISMIDRAFT_420162 [Pisolithus microcarpus 441]
MVGLFDWFFVSKQPYLEEHYCHREVVPEVEKLTDDGARTTCQNKNAYLTYSHRHHRRLRVVAERRDKSGGGSCKCLKP